MKRGGTFFWGICSNLLSLSSFFAYLADYRFLRMKGKRLVDGDSQEDYLRELGGTGKGDGDLDLIPLLPSMRYLYCLNQRSGNLGFIYRYSSNRSL